jgi:hypothetical protein
MIASFMVVCWRIIDVGCGRRLGGGGCDEGKILQLMDEAAGSINFPAALYLRSVCRQIRRDSFINGLKANRELGLGASPTS